MHPHALQLCYTVTTSEHNTACTKQVSGLFKPLDCAAIASELLAAQAEFGRKISVRAGQAAVGLDKHVC